jgi:hypothetical protein
MSGDTRLQCFHCFLTQYLCCRCTAAAVALLLQAAVCCLLPLAFCLLGDTAEFYIAPIMAHVSQAVPKMRPRFAGGVHSSSGEQLLLQLLQQEHQQ